MLYYLLIHLISNFPTVVSVVSVFNYEHFDLYDAKKFIITFYRYRIPGLWINFWIIGFILIYYDDIIINLMDKSVIK